MANEKSQLNPLNTFIEYFYIKKTLVCLKQGKKSILGAHNLDLPGRYISNQKKDMMKRLE